MVLNNSGKKKNSRTLYAGDGSLAKSFRVEYN